MHLLRSLRRRVGGALRGDAETSMNGRAYVPVLAGLRLPFDGAHRPPVGGVLSQVVESVYIERMPLDRGCRIRPQRGPAGGLVWTAISVGKEEFRQSRHARIRSRAAAISRIRARRLHPTGVGALYIIAVVGAQHSR